MVFYFVFKLFDKISFSYSSNSYERSTQSVTVRRISCGIGFYLVSLFTVKFHCDFENPIHTEVRL